MSDSTKFYNLSRILSKDCQYNIIIGERSNGKTYSTLEYGIRQWVDHGEQMAYVRRYREDFRGKRGDTLFGNELFFFHIILSATVKLVLRIISAIVNHINPILLGLPVLSVP